MGADIAGLANKAEFTQAQFQRDLTSAYPDLLTYATLDNFEAQPEHATATDADIRLKMQWSTVVGPSTSTRDLHVVKNGNEWQVEWPIRKMPVVPPQVVPVNYLRWDVIYRTAGDDLGAQDVEAPHVRIVNMHPVQRAEGLVLLGELLNEDVVPAYVSVAATLVSKIRSQSRPRPASTDISPAFAKTDHALLYSLSKRVAFGGRERADDTVLTLVGIRRSAIEIENEKLNPAPDASLTGQLTNQSGQIANVAHVLGTFYNKSGQVIWVGDQYVDHALLPQTPVAFNIHIPEDLARKVSSERTVVSTLSFGGSE